MISSMPSDAAAQLTDLADRYWESFLAYNPIYATYLGDRRFDALLDDRTDGARRARRSVLVDIRERTEKVPEDELEGEDRITRWALIEQTGRDEAEIDADVDAWSVDPTGGPHVIALDLGEFQPIRTPDEAAAMVTRWRAMGPWFDHHIRRLREAAAAGRVSVRSPAERTIDQLDSVLAQSDDEIPVPQPALRGPCGLDLGTTRRLSIRSCAPPFARVFGRRSAAIEMPSAMTSCRSHGPTTSRGSSTSRAVRRRIGRSSGCTRP